MLGILKKLEHHGFALGPISAFVDYSEAHSFKPNDVLRPDRRITKTTLEHRCAVPDGRKLASVLFFRPNPSMAQCDLIKLIHDDMGCRLTIPVENKAVWAVTPHEVKQQLIAESGAANVQRPLVVMKNLSTKVVVGDIGLIPVQVLRPYGSCLFSIFVEPDLGRPMPANWMVGVTRQD